MPFINDILQYDSLSIVGLEKNTGKTECLKYVLDRLPVQTKHIAVTSIGIDGETVDQVTRTQKPEIVLREGMYFGTSEAHYRLRRLVSELIDVSDESTSLGRVVTAKALTGGKILLSGPSSASSLRRWMHEMQQRFVVQDIPMDIDLPPLAYKVHDIFQKAAGDNHVLDSKELETFMDDKANAKLMRQFLELLCTKRDVKYYDKHKDEMAEVYGFKRFLGDFTLAGERNLSETKLWRDYLVWATLFGNAAQLTKDMQRVNPEFFKMDEVAVQMSGDTNNAGSEALSAVSNVLMISEGILRERMLDTKRQRRKANKSKKHHSTVDRDEGRGGRSSRGGGGGGFSGGGGGGIR